MKTLRTLCLSITLLFIFSINGNTQNYSYMGAWDPLGVPDYLDPDKDSLSPDFMMMIWTTLPESQPVPIYNPEFISEYKDTEILIGSDSVDVWVSWVSDGASYKNVLGYFTYELSPPMDNLPDPPADSNITIIFPNAKLNGDGGGLLPGDKVYLGKFPPHTGIGWVVLADGFVNSQVTSGLWTLYSVPFWNPEPQDSLQRHNVLLKDTTNKIFVLGFEDRLRDSSFCDQDFNDVVFNITVEPYGAVIGNYPIITGPEGGVGTGGNSGVESNGTLATHIAQRNFNRVKSDKKINYDNKSSLPILSTVKQESLLNRNVTESDLLNYIPESSSANTIAYITTPSDLLGITNAKEIFAADYFNNYGRMAAILATSTEYEIYEHTKVICDRKAGAILENISYTVINGHTFIMSKLIQPDGSIEYSSGFTAYVNNGDFEIDCHWSIDEYESRPLNYNFQVWSNSEAMTRSLLTDIILMMHDYANVTYNYTNDPEIPKVFIRSGHYSGGELHLNIKNTVAASEIILEGSIAKSETSQREDVIYVQNLNGQEIQNISINTSGVFDIGFKLNNNSSPESDVVYFSDGTWGIDYVSSGASINYFEVFEETSFTAITENIYPVERPLRIEGKVKNYVSIYRELPVERANANLNDYNAIEFNAYGNDQEILITLVDKNIQLWADQFKTKVYLNANSSKFTVPYSSFSSTLGYTLDAGEIVTIVFSITNDGINYRDFELSLNNLKFINTNAFGIEENKMETVNAYPNPFNNYTNVNFSLEESEQVDINIYDLTGKIIESESKVFDSGNHSYTFYKGSHNTGIYFCEILTSKGTLNTKLVIQ